MNFDDDLVAMYLVCFALPTLFACVGHTLRLQASVLYHHVFIRFYKNAASSLLLYVLCVINMFIYIVFVCILFRICVPVPAYIAESLPQ